MGKQDFQVDHLREWVNLYTDHLYAWAYSKTNDKELSEDLVQDTFLVAHQSLNKFRGDSNPKTWLSSILKNKIYDHFRKKYNSPQVLSDSEAVLESMFDESGRWKKEERPKPWSDDDDDEIKLLDDKDFIHVMQGCMKELPQNWHTAVQLKYFSEKKGEEICQELDVSPTNFWQIIHRSKLQLRKCLEKHWFNQSN